MESFHTSIKYNFQTRIGHILTNHFVPEQILACGNARRDGEGDFSFVCNHSVHAPRLVGRVQTIFPDLEPFQARHVGLSSIGNLSTSGVLAWKTVLSEKRAYRYDMTGPAWT